VKNSEDVICQFVHVSSPVYITNFSEIWYNIHTLKLPDEYHISRSTVTHMLHISQIKLYYNSQKGPNVQIIM